MRSTWKGLFITHNLAKEFLEKPTQTDNFKESKKTLTVYSRSSTILPCFVGYDCSVYNGRRFFFFSITEAHVGYKFGEFSPTRKNYKPKIKSPKKNTSKKNK